MGIAADFLPHVFERFRQADSTSTRQHGGLGLGLAIVRNLVRMHHGEIRATSAGLGMGSTFEIQLPLAHATHAAPKRDTHPTGSRVPRRVLVVDDNIDIADMMSEVLKEAGHVVRVAHDGKQALSALAGFTPDAVLLDIGLPVMDGFEVARELRSRGSDAFLVAITGYGQQTDRDRSKDAGFDAHLVKPVKVDAVLRLLDRLAE
jgi:CheY-like chemotaxis protein